jgi:hypothetical protein
MLEYENCTSVEKKYKCATYIVETNMSCVSELKNSGPYMEDSISSD